VLVEDYRELIFAYFSKNASLDLEQVNPFHIAHNDNFEEKTFE
jgi:hypothetical protein